MSQYNCVDFQISKLGDLLQVTAEKDVDLFVTVRKLGMVSLLEVFKDIIPGYHIRSLTETEKSQKVFFFIRYDICHALVRGVLLYLCDVSY